MSSPSFYAINLWYFCSVLPGPAEQFLARVGTRRGDPQVLKRGLGLVVQVLRDRHLKGRAQVAERPVLAAGSPAWDTDYRPVRRARLDAHGDRGTAVRRHLDIRAERELGNRHRHGHGQVVPAPAEHVVRLDVDPYEQVARLAAVLARCPLTGNPDPLPVGIPGGDAHLDAPRAHRPAAAAA